MNSVRDFFAPVLKQQAPVSVSGTRSFTTSDAKTDIDEVLRRNEAWAQSKTADDPDYFKNISKTHRPKYLYIGCADARVPATELLGAEKPGVVFVHRNVANLVVSTDANLQSVMQYAVTALEVPNIIICGHYGCGGVQASMQRQDHGAPLEDWIRNVRDVYRLHRAELDAIDDEKKRFDRLVELNVLEQALNIYKSGVVQRVRAETGTDQKTRQRPQITPMVYDISTGRLKVLDLEPSQLERLDPIYDMYPIDDPSSA